MKSEIQKIHEKLENVNNNVENSTFAIPLAWLFLMCENEKLKKKINEIENTSNNEWIIHNGKSTPRISKNKFVYLKLRNGIELKIPYLFKLTKGWIHQNIPTDIISYKVLK